MREHMRDHAGDAAPLDALCARARRLRRARRLVEIMRPGVVGTSVMPPSRPFGGRVRTSTHAVGAHDDEGRAAAQRAFRASAPCAETFRVAARARRAAVRPGTERAGRLLRRADGGAEVHQRLREIAGAALRHQRSARSRRIFRLRRRQFRLRRHKSRAITRSILPSTGTAARVERDRRDRRRGVAADAGQRAQLVFASPETVRRGARPPPARRHAGCARARNSRARPRPSAHRRAAPRRALRHSASAPGSAEIGPDRLHGGLLQHDLGQPDVIGIGASRPAPRATAAGGGGGRTRRATHAALGAVVLTRRFVLSFGAAVPATLMMQPM